MTCISSDAHFRLVIASSALTAVRELCVEACAFSPESTLAHVGADNLASLLGIIAAEMEAALRLPTAEAARSEVAASLRA